MSQPPPPPGISEAQILSLLDRMANAQDNTSAILNKLSQTSPKTNGDKSSKLKIAPPAEFHGQPEETRRFIQQCESHFTSDLSATDEQKIECALSYMRGEFPSLFVDQVRERRSRIPIPKEGEKLEELIQAANENFCHTWDKFVELFKQTFFEADVQAKAQAKLRRIRQGARSADEFRLEFERYQAEAGFDHVTLALLFQEGLNNWLSERIRHMDTPPEEDNLVMWKDKAVYFDRIERRIKERRLPAYVPRTTPSYTPRAPLTTGIRPRFIPKYSPPAGPPPSQTRPTFSSPPNNYNPPRAPSQHVPMEVDRTRQRQPVDLATVECYKCHQKGHYAKDCYAKISVARIVERDDGSVEILEELVDTHDVESVPAAQEENTAEEHPSPDFYIDPE